MRRPTLKDVAEATGYSASTVSRALAGSPQISESTRRRIGAAARRLGYQADPIGSLLRAPRPRVLGLLCRLDQELHVVYRDHILARAEAHGLRLVTESVGPLRGAGEAIGNLHRLRCQTLIIIDPATVAQAEPALLEGSVTIGQQRPVAASDLVTSDNSGGMAQLIDHLRGLGHRRLLYIDSTPGVSADARRRAFQQAAGQAGLAFHTVAGGADVDSGLAALAPLLDRAGGLRPDPGQEPCTAVVCYNDQCAQGAIIAALRAGLRPGADLSVAGVDNSRLAASAAFDLTSIDRSPAEVARLAVELAEARVESGSPAHEPVSRTVGTTLVPRSSTGPARR